MSSKTCSTHGGYSPHRRIFEKPADLAFTNLRYAFGPGWAAVVWTAGTQGSTSGGEGVTMLEIRGGKIARETVYYTSINVPFYT